MKLKISHLTQYRYEGATQFSLQRLRLTPLSNAGQRILDWQVRVEGAAPEVQYDDQFGNRVSLVSLTDLQSTIQIVASGEVETQNRNGIIGPHTGFCPLWLFLRETTLTKPGKRIHALVEGLEGKSELAQMHALMSALHDTMDFNPGSSSPDTTAEEALEAGRGVCQDYAHILIAGARLLKLPARYVSGYLLLNHQVEQTASHAWSEVHLPGLGWVGFDAANNICPDDRYVRMASGLCYRDAAPVSGIRVGAPGEHLSVTLTVESQEQFQSQSQSQN